MVKEKAKKTSASKRMEKELVGNEEVPSKIWEDPRFQHLVSDPRFKNLPKEQRKVKIDKRFQGMFTDEKFQVKYAVDKYGRKIHKTNSEDLRKYYELSSGSDDEDEILEEQQREEKAITNTSLVASSSPRDSEYERGEKDEENDGEEVSVSLKERLLDPNIDYARGEGRLVTDSSSGEESSEEDDPELYIDHVWGELDADAATINDATQRLAVCNMDWDRIRAQDLMVLFHSFLPPGGCILSIKIYPSDFGKERMAEEETHGPTELKALEKADKEKREKTDPLSESHSDSFDLVQEQDSDAEEGDEYHMEKLRQYQLNRLRYYYAVVEFDRAETADKIYKECDGIEYESSATKVDLRFIPNEISFDDDDPSDICTEMPDINSYKPRQFTTTALQQAKVDLTWDETAVERRELSDKLASGRINEVDDNDLRKIVAYSSEDDEEDNENDEVMDKLNNGKDDFFLADSEERQEKKKGAKKKEDMINKYKALLVEINEKEETERKSKHEMEFSWNVENQLEDKDDKDTNTAIAKSSNLTAIEKVLQKRTEKNKKRKEERKKRKMGDNSLDLEDSDLDSIPDGIDMNDPYFAEEFANGDFINPSKSKTQKKKQMKLDKGNDEDEKRKLQELSLLLDDDEESGKQHFSLETIIQSEQETKSRKKRRKHLKKAKSTIIDERKELDDNFEINLYDERFKAIYSSPNFNIDPTDSHFKGTKSMEKIINEKLKRHGGTNEGIAESRINGGISRDVKDISEKRVKSNLDNTILIKSLKRKLQYKSIP